MQDLSDKELDQFFVDSELNHNINFEESSWLKLESKLRERSKNRIAKMRLALALILLLGGLLIVSKSAFWNQKETGISRKHKKNGDNIYPRNGNILDEDKKSWNKVEQEEISKGKNVGSSDLFEIRKEEDVLNLTSLKAGGPFERNVAKRFETKNQLAGENLISRKVNNKNDNAWKQGKKYVGENILLTAKNPTGERSASYDLNSSDVKVNENKLSLNAEANFRILDNDDPEKSNRGDKNFNKIENNAYLENGTSLIQKSSSIDSINSDSMLTVEKDNSTSLIKRDDKKAISEDTDKSRRGKFSLGILVAPDVNSVGFFKAGAPGIALGVMGEYHLTDRWSIQTGLIRSSKTYSSQHGYNSMEGYWAYKNDADRIDGSCKVLDIPLNIKYHLFTGTQSRFFVSTGLSSYLMYNEKYSFVYKSTGSTRSWDSKKMNNYYFNVSNFSIGYERYISTAFSIQAEPFIKIPLKNVGDGKIRLITTGVFFSLKYTFISK